VARIYQSCSSQPHSLLDTDNIFYIRLEEEGDFKYSAVELYVRDAFLKTSHNSRPIFS
jgi:hypothetical protein